VVAVIPLYSRRPDLLPFDGDANAAITAADLGYITTCELTFSRRRDSTGGHQSSPEEDVLTPEGDAYLFSNSNFTDVQRQLCAIDDAPPV
jgi:hypothetical protein